VPLPTDFTVLVEEDILVGALVSEILLLLILISPQYPDEMYFHLFILILFQFFPPSVVLIKELSPIAHPI